MNEPRGYNWVVYSPRNDYGSQPDFVQSSDASSLTGYTSIYAVTESDAKAIVETGTTAKFKGSVWSERLWIDLDGREKITVVEDRLKGLGYGFVVYDTGGRGCHVGILRDAFPSHLLPEQDKAWVRETVPEADTSIYTHLHLFRLPGTLHERTGAEKVLLREHPGESLEYAKYDRNTAPGVVSDAGTLRPGTNRRSVFSCYSVMSDLGKVRVGNRHATLVRVCYSLRDFGVSSTAALWWLTELNKGFEEPKDVQEIEKVVKDVYVRS